MKVRKKKQAPQYAQRWKIIRTVSQNSCYNAKCTVTYINFLRRKVSLLAHRQSWILDLRV